MSVKISLIVLLLGACEAVTAQEPTSPDAQRPSSPPAGARAQSEELATRIARLIVQLGDKQYEVREAASRSLGEIGSHARTALELAVSSDDAEVASRAQMLLGKLPKYTHTVVDALGQPIPLAFVTIAYSQRRPVEIAAVPGGELPSVQGALPLVSSTSEVDGRIVVPEMPSANTHASVSIEHDDYGIARIDNIDLAVTKSLQFPLVRRDTEAARRAATGVVVTADGNRVAGAIVHCTDVRTPGEGLIEGKDPRGVVVSDRQGRFTYYLPPSEVRHLERGVLIPANSRYGLRITVPGNDALFPWGGRCGNLEPARIELLQASRFHRFRFAAVGGGWLSDVKELQQVRIQHDALRDGERILIDLGAAAAANGCKLPPGKYVAEWFGNGKATEYLPIVVSDDSAEELTFTLPPAVTFRGRVVHGDTGKPASAALVIGWNSTSRNNLALLTADDWAMLHDTPSNPPSDHPAMRRLGEFYGVRGLVRTDRDGQFEITRQPDEEYYGLLAFDENLVPFFLRVGALKPDDKHQVDAGEFPLFPAAKIVVKPEFAGPHLAVAPRWFPAKAGQPEWFDRFEAAGRSSERGFEYVHWLTLNESQPVYVPAQLHLNVNFETPYDEEWDSAVVADVRLEPGATKEMGDLHFAANLPVTVRVMDERGNSVEGAPIRQKLLDDNGWSVAHNTDAEGLARFYAPRGGEGQFWLSDLPGTMEAQHAENLLTKYTIGSEAPAEAFTITITEAQLRLLLRRTTP